MSAAHICGAVRVMLAWPHQHEGDPAALPRRPAHARSSEGLPLPAGAEMIVTFFSAAWSSAATRSWRSISPGRAWRHSVRVTTQITGIRWRLLTCPVATLDGGGGVMGERVALVRR